MTSKHSHTPLFQRPSFEIGCTITIEHTDASLEAHVELDGDVQPTVGDRITVHGAHVQVPYGEKLTLRRQATIRRANQLEKIWVKIRSLFELTELYEVSFSPGRI